MAAGRYSWRWYYLPVRKDGKTPDQRGPVQSLPGAVPVDAGFGEPTDAAKHMNSIIDQMETYTKHKIECFLCLKSDSDRDVNESKAARGFYEDGWRLITVGDTMGVACAYCVKNPSGD